MGPKLPSLDTDDLETQFHNNQPSFMFLAETSSQSSDSVSWCRICLCSGDEKLIAPCKCAGSSRYVHASCLVTWFKTSVKHQCELCMSDVKIRKINRPILLWRRPEDGPVPILLLIVNLMILSLMIVAISGYASDGCESTWCLVFYVIGGSLAVLLVLVLPRWFFKYKPYWKKWRALNQDWFIDGEEAERYPV
ncbi:E3 ubiquitin-protein ligase MARCHF2-like [Clytia hemisphaerica]|uniref:RING-CH-type domain-containing protein n=1 Tax=Clytia hemisphaerica TaxID=252671 RepID=A0A7M5U8S3_9CNID